MKLRSVFGVSVVIFMAAGLVHCSSNSASSQTASTQSGGVFYYPPEPDDKRAVADKIQDFSLSCADANDCPTNVGLVLSIVHLDADTIQTGQCTGFLISPTVVATNSHCIPDALKTAGADCSQILSIRFMDNAGADPTIFACQKVISFTPVVQDTPDIAFFQIASSARATNTIIKTGLNGGEKISAMQVNPLTTDAGGTLARTSCEIVFNTAIDIDSTNGWSKTAVAYGCHVVEGNSGSPVFNQSGSVVGILQAQVPTAPPNTEISPKLGSPAQLPPNFIFTNFSCISDPVFGGYQTQMCDEAAKLTVQQCWDQETSGESAKGSAAMTCDWNS